MRLVFFCSGCGARFEVDAAHAGKRARCKQCGQPTVIPHQAAASRPRVPAASAASAVALPVSAPAGGSNPSSVAAAPRDWLEAMVASQVGLKPLSVAAMPAIRRPNLGPSPLDDASFSGLYVVKPPIVRPTVKGLGQPSKPAGFLTRFYRGKIGGVQGLMRFINESAYLLSVPFLVLLIFGVLVQNKPLAYLGATLVVLLNIGRFLSGLVNLVLIEFRASPLKGILFLIPPINLFVIAGNWKKYRKPTLRIVEPALTLAAVVLAFTFVPWLTSTGEKRTGNLTDQLKQGVQELEAGIQQKLGTLPADVKALPEQAKSFLRNAEQRITPGKAPTDSSPEGRE